MPGTERDIAFSQLAVKGLNQLQLFDASTNDNFTILRGMRQKDKITKIAV
jgi:hypothetical protein